MNDKAISRETKKTDKTADKSTHKSRFSVGMWLLALFSLLAIVLSAMAWLQLLALKTDSGTLPTTFNKIETRISSLETALSGAEQEKRQLQTQLAAIQQEQTAMSVNLNVLFEQQGMDNDDWALAEIEHLLIIATHRLQLDANVAIALAAMQAAEDRLRDNRDPGLLAVRRQLTTDLNALKAVEAVDISGLVLFLSDLVGRVHELPLQQARVVADEEKVIVSEQKNSKWEKLSAAIWQELRSLVLISRSGDESIATLLPEEQYFLYQNLRLQLESARYAVLRRDTDNLHVSLDIIQSWLEDYFDTGDRAVTNILESLSQMTVLDLNPPLPDISSSLETLHAYVKTQEDAVTIIPQAVPEPEQ